MVATVVPISSVSGTVQYFETEGCHPQDRAEHRRASRWHGQGAKLLRLGRLVDGPDFERVLKGYVPGTEVRLGRARHGEHRHRAGIDLTLSAPKSVSLEVGLYGDDRVSAAHRRAVEATLDFVEVRALMLRQYDPVTKRSPRLPARDMLAATFLHVCSREGDPQLHTHCVIASMGRDAAGDWRALELSNLPRMRRLLGAYYRNELARQLLAQRFVLVPSMAGGIRSFEIAGYSAKFRDAFSTRRRQILAYVEEHRLEYGSAATQRANLATRRRKREPRYAESRARWADQAVALRLERDRAASRRPRGCKPATPSATPLEVVVRTMARVEQRTSVFNVDDVLTLSLAYAPGAHTLADLEGVLDRLTRDGHLLSARRRRVREAYVTLRTQRAKRDLIGWVRDGLRVARPLVNAMHFERVLAKEGTSLSEDQEAGVRTALLSCSRVVGWCVFTDATGTAMLRTVLGLAGKRQVLGLAVSVAGVRLLSDDLGIGARTLESFLARFRDVADNVLSDEALGHLRAKFRGAIIVAREATSMSMVQACGLLRIARRLHIGRVLLVADTRQLRARDAEQPFLVQRDAGMPTVAIGLAWSDKGLENAGALTAASVQGQIAEGANLVGTATEDLADSVANTWLALSSEVRASTAVVVPDPVLRGCVNDRIREALVDEGVLGLRELEVETLVDRRLTGAQKRDGRSYANGDVVLFHQDFWRYRIVAGDVCEVIAADEAMVRMRHADGKPRHFRPARRIAYGINVYERLRISLRPGDLIRWTRDDHHRGLVDGARATVVAIRTTTLRVRTADGRLLSMRHADPQLRHVAHAHVSSGQGGEGAWQRHAIVALDSGHDTLGAQARLYAELRETRDQTVAFTDNLEQFGEAVRALGGLTVSGLKASDYSNGVPEADLGRAIVDRMRRSGSPLGKTVPSLLPAAESTRATLDAWRRDRDRHKQAAASAGTHPSRHPGHGALAARLREIAGARDLPAAVAARVREELTLHETMSQVPLLTLRSTAAIQRLLAVRNRLYVPSKGDLANLEAADRVLDARYDLWRDEMADTAADALRLLGRDDLGLTALTGECARLHATLRDARERLTEDDRCIAALAASRAAADWVRTWDRHGPRERVAEAATDAELADTMARGRELLVDQAIPEAWAAAIQTRMDTHAALLGYSALRADWLASGGGETRPSVFHENASAAALVERARRQHANSSLPTLHREWLGTRLAVHEWSRARSRIHEQTRVGEMGFHEHPETPALMVSAEKLIARGTLFAAERRELEGDRKAHRQWLERHAAAVSEFQRWAEDRRGVARDARHRSAADHEPAEAGALAERARALARRDVTIAQRQELLEYVRSRDDWEARRAQEARDAYRAWSTTDSEQRRRAARDGVSVHGLSERRELIRQARSLTKDPVSDEARETLRRALTEDAVWRRRRGSAIERLRSWHRDHARVAARAASAKMPFHAHEDTVALMERARDLCSDEALPAQDRGDLSASIASHDAWIRERDAVSIYRSLATERKRLFTGLRRRSAAEMDAEIDALLEKEAALANEPALPSEERATLRDHLARHDAADAAFGAWEEDRRILEIMATEDGLDSLVHPGVDSVVEQGRRLVTLGALRPTHRAAVRHWLREAECGRICRDIRGALDAFALLDDIDRAAATADLELRVVAIEGIPRTQPSSDDIEPPGYRYVEERLTEQLAAFAVLCERADEMLADTDCSPYWRNRLQGDREEVAAKQSVGKRFLSWASECYEHSEAAGAGSGPSSTRDPQSLIETAESLAEERDLGALARYLLRGVLDTCRALRQGPAAEPKPRPPIGRPGPTF